MGDHTMGGARNVQRAPIYIYCIYIYIFIYTCTCIYFVISYIISLTSSIIFT